MPHFPAETFIRSPESTENIPSSRRVRDVADRIAYLDPDAAPFVQILSRAKKKVAVNSKFEWIEKSLAPKWSQINNGGGYTAGSTSLVVDAGAYFSIGDIVNVVRTAEKLRVTNVVTNTLTVTRSVGGTAAAALLDNDDLQIIGNAYAEGSTSGAEKSHVETYPYNYTQITRTPFGATGTESESENYTGPDRKRLRAEKAIEHKLELERTAIFGERDIDTGSTANPIRYTGGLLQFLTSNITDIGGVLTEAEVETALESIFGHTAAGSSRTAFAGARVISVLDQLALGRLQLVPSDRTYGLTVKQWVTGHGELMIVKHRLLENGPGGTGYGNHMLVVDPSKCSYRFMRNRDTKLRVDIQANDLDGWKDEYMTEVGWQVENPAVHGILHNITA